ncbi:hypothetical protein N802_15470 [Knoellia sinensis KCTC 19936]|uniref:Uncharacterized protein n=1 Tax=Knoellia sinensis KCTC 19936 TaxID=1385520 RepID=A0A0A0J788_9MICO|nr:hypothetical protein N802_15470 [Knoellia sinensis KCTC 19936]
MACVVTTLLSGCTPANGGLIGVTVDESGKPVFLLNPCEGEIDTFTVAMVGPNHEPGSDFSWHRRSGVLTEPTDFAPYGNDPDWESDTALPEHLGSEDVFSVAAEENGFASAHRTRGLSVNAAELAELKPGEVLHNRYDSSDQPSVDASGTVHPVGNKRTDRAGFAELACR